jgi:hypothetical protein
MRAGSAKAGLFTAATWLMWLVLASVGLMALTWLSEQLFFWGWVALSAIYGRA